MALVEPIKVEGLAKFARDLRKLDNDLPKALRIATNEAGELIVTRTKPKVPTGPNRGGHAVASIKTRSTRTEGRVTAGGKKYPYYPWLDFGGRTGRKRSVKRTFMKTGRYLFDTYEENREQVQRKLIESLIDVARQAGVEVNE